MSEEVLSDRRYTKDHEWAKSEGAQVRMGISDHAQHELGDVVFVELPKVGDTLKQGQSLGTVESVKAVSDVYSPVDGKVTAVNEKLIDSPQLINDSPYENGWMAVIEPSNAAQVNGLLDSTAYSALLAEITK